MKKINSALRRADMSQRSLLKLQSLGFMVMVVGILMALLGNAIHGGIGQVILLLGIALAIIGGLIAAPGLF